MTENREITFTLYGKQHRLTRDQVEHSVAGWDPAPIDKYSVRIGRRSFPIKQVFGLTLDIPPAEFTSQQAYGILRRLGFEIETRR
ncbi:MAG: hypothetical protein WBY93_15290 [Candidatus Binatus sp.]